MLSRAVGAVLGGRAPLGSSSANPHIRRSILLRVSSSTSSKPPIPRVTSCDTATFSNAAQHTSFLQTQAALPRGFRVSSHVGLPFTPQEAPHMRAKMNLSLIVPDVPTPHFTAVFTKNAFPGAPVHIGRSLLSSPRLGAIVINNKVSNVCPRGGGLDDAARVCAAVAATLALPADAAVLPCSTGVIGWRLPVDQMVHAMPAATAGLQSESIMPVARGIMTTDLYPKIRAESVCGGRIVGIAKGAGMIEPNMATMLSYILTDVAVPRDVLRAMLPRVVDPSFNSISVDSDMSTSDTVVLASSAVVQPPATTTAGSIHWLREFEAALRRVCVRLAGDVVRNGEGVRHVMRVAVSGAPSREAARGVGKAIVNSPLFKCAVTGDDPNVGRVVAAVGRYVSVALPGVSLDRCRISIGGRLIFEHGQFRLDAESEAFIVSHMRAASLYDSSPTVDVDPATGRLKPGASSVHYAPPVRFPRHERCVEISVELGASTSDSNRNSSAVVYGADLSHEYVAENADYRS